MQERSLAHNIKIEPMLIHPRTWGIETIKQNEQHEHNFRDPRRQQGYHSGESN